MKKNTVQTEFGPVTVIRSKDYFCAQFVDHRNPMSIEAWPMEGNLGPIFFRSGHTLFFKKERESWETLWASLDPGWAVIPWFRVLVTAAGF